DAKVKQYYRSVPPEFFDFDDFPGTFFIKHQHAPLKQYMIERFKNEHETSTFLGWGKVSPTYSAYGNYLILHYPISFARYYMWTNTKRYLNPFLEKFGSYNVGMDSVWLPAKYWFKYKTAKIQVGSSTLLEYTFYLYPFLFMLLNIYFSIGLTYLFVTGKFR